VAAKPHVTPPSPQDVAVYGGLCALASFDRAELKAKVSVLRCRGGSSVDTEALPGPLLEGGCESSMGRRNCPGAQLHHSLT
jgi:hypothetical protein